MRVRKGLAAFASVTITLILVIIIIIGDIDLDSSPQYLEFRAKRSLEEDFPPLSPLSLGVSFFLGYLFTETVRLVRPWQLGDYPFCGTAQFLIDQAQEDADTFVGQICLSSCKFMDVFFGNSSNSAQYGTVLNVAYNQITIVGRLITNRIPIDITCLDNCVAPQPNITRCLDAGLTRLECLVIFYSEPIPANDSTSSQVILAYSNQFLSQQLVSYCVQEQLEMNEFFQLWETPALSGSSVCNSITGYCDCNSTAGIKRREYTWNERGLREKIKQRQVTVPPAFIESLLNVDPVLHYNPIDEGGAATVISNKWPWLCSLHLRTAPHLHQCFVTLLSAPPRPTILVGSAHCNFICKDATTREILNSCCCQVGGCKNQNTQKTCGPSAKLTEGDPFDYAISCGKFRFGPVGETMGGVTLKVDKLTIHPNFNVSKPDPINGFDIAVYHVFMPGVIIPYMFDSFQVFPACLPDPNLSGLPVDGIFTSKSGRIFSFDINRTSSFLGDSNMILSDCKDPSWMGSNTFYPAGTVCYRDPSENSCLGFGNSGSPMVHLFPDSKNGIERGRWVGALSLSKSCDNTIIFQNRQIRQIIPSSQNGGTFSDGRCYMEWIAAQYGTRPPPGWKPPSSCINGAAGDPNDQDKTTCRTINGGFCNFDAPNFSECKLVSDPAPDTDINYNVYQCIDTTGLLTNCANNCKGVGSRAVIIGGIITGLAAASIGVAAPSLITAGSVALPVGVAGTAGALMLMSNGMCPPGQCRVGPRCCDLVQVGRRRVCPRFCAARRQEGTSRQPGFLQVIANLFQDEIIPQVSKFYNEEIKDLDIF